MIDVVALRKHIEENSDVWMTIDQLASGIGFTGNPSEVRNELSNLQLVTYNTGDFAWQALESTPMVIESPEHPAVWHLSSSMLAEDWNRVLQSCVSRALGSEQKSERIYWLSRAAESLQSMTKLEG